MHVEIQKFTQWLRCKSPHTSTHIHYGNDLKLFFIWANKPPTAITVSDVDAYITHCQAQGHALATHIFVHISFSPQVVIRLSDRFHRLLIMPKMLATAIPQNTITDFCRRHHIRQLALFGSALRPDFQSDSDVDVLVEFEPDHIPGLAFFAMQDELSQILGYIVDLNTLQFISPEFRQQVQAEAEVIYEQA